MVALAVALGMKRARLTFKYVPATQSTTGKQFAGGTPKPKS